MPAKISGSVGLNLTELKANIKDLNSQMKLVESAFKAASDGSTEWGQSQAGLESQIKRLTDLIEIQKQKIANLKEEKSRLIAKYGETHESVRRVEIRINNETAALNKNTYELQKTQNALEKLGSETDDVSEETEESTKKLKEGENQLKSYGKETERSSEKTSKLAAALGGLGKAAVAGLAALSGVAAAGAIKLGKEVVEQYGELERTIEGSAAVFGDYAEEIQRVGEEAYKNLGLSQSEYLAKANKMGALFQGSGLDQQRTLELTTQAMQRAADMAAIMGIDTSEAMDAISAAAKGNFTMMDNLGVAMNATTLEAYALSKGLDFAWDSANNAEKAELAMQMFFERTEQYAGSFASKSSTTITGSIGMLQAATQSFIAGLGNANADMTKLTGNLIDSFSAVVSNITPVLDNIIDALPAAAEALLAALGDMLPELINTISVIFEKVLQTITKLMPKLVPAGVKAITTIFNALMANLPMLTSAAITMITTLIRGLNSALPKIITAAIEIIKLLVGALGENVGLIIEVGAQLIIELAGALIGYIPELIPVAVEIILNLVQGLIDSLPMIIDVALDLILALVDGILNALPIIIEQAPQIIMSLIDGLVGAIPQLVDAAVKIINALIEFLCDPNNLALIITAAVDIIAALAKGMIDSVDKIIDAIPKITKSIWDTLKNVDWKNLGKNIVEGLANGIKDFGYMFVNAISDLANKGWNKFRDFFGIHSPSRLMRQDGQYLGIGLALGIKDSYKDVQEAMVEVNRAIKVNPIETSSRITSVDGVPVGKGAVAGSNIVVNLTQYNTSPKALSARDTYIAMRKAERDLKVQLGALQ